MYYGSKRNLIYAYCLAGLLLAGCTSTVPVSPSAGAAEQVSGEMENTFAASGSLSAEQTAILLSGAETPWDAEVRTTVFLNGASGKISGQGAAFNGNRLQITQAGIYVLEGSFNGQIHVNSGKGSNVQLVLKGVDITCADNAALFVEKAGVVTITAASGTENSLTDGESYTLYAGQDELPKAALYCKSDLVLEGQGTLTVNGLANDGISGRDALTITGGHYIVSAGDDGIVGKDSLTAQNCVVEIVSGGDGMKSSNDTDAGMGNVVLLSGDYTIDSQSDGVQAERVLDISGGVYHVVTKGGSANAPVQSGNENGFGGGMRGQRGQAAQPPVDASAAQTTAYITEEAVQLSANAINPYLDESDAATSENDSFKGFKSGENMTISGGSFVVDTYDDAFHSNGTLTLSGGVFDISTGDDGIHADGALVSDGVEVLIRKSYEGIESTPMTLQGGVYNITASDDGINVAGGDSGSMMRGGGAVSNPNLQLTISGGEYYVTAGGDGVDVNGNLYVSGGLVVVSNPPSGANGALDADGAIEVTGGTLVMAGGAQMAMAPDSASTQNSISMTFPQAQAAGTVFSLLNKDGNAVLTVAPVQGYQNVMVSGDFLKAGETYTIVTGGTPIGSPNEFGYYADPTVTGGTEIVSAAIGEGVTYLNESGVTTGSGGFGGFGGGRGGFGGMTPPADGTLPPTLPDGTPPSLPNGMERPARGQRGQIPTEAADAAGAGA